MPSTWGASICRKTSCARFGIPESGAWPAGEIYPGWNDLVAHQVARARTYFATRLRSPALHSAPARGVRANDGRHLRRVAQENRARSGASVTGARGALQDGKIARRRAVVALERVAVVGGGPCRTLRRASRSKMPARTSSFSSAARLLGGRATSFEIDGIEVDNGQHVFLACCTEFIAFARARRHGGRSCTCKIGSTRASFSRDGRNGRAARAARCRRRCISLESFRDVSVSYARAKNSASRSALVASRCTCVDGSRRRNLRRLAAAQRARRRGTPRVLGSVLHSGAQRAVRSRRGGRRAVRVADRFFARRERGAIRLFKGAARTFRGRGGGAARRRRTPRRACLSVEAATRPTSVALRRARAIDTLRLRRGRACALPPRQVERILGDPQRLRRANLDAYDAFPIVDVHLWHDGGRSASTLQRRSNRRCNGSSKSRRATVLQHQRSRRVCARCRPRNSNRSRGARCKLLCRSSRTRSLLRGAVTRNPEATWLPEVGTHAYLAAHVGRARRNRGRLDRYRLARHHGISIRSAPWQRIAAAAKRPRP